MIKPPVVSTKFAANAQNCQETASTIGGHMPPGLVHTARAPPYQSMGDANLICINVTKKKGITCTCAG